MKDFKNVHTINAYINPYKQVMQYCAPGNSYCRQ